MEQPSLSSLYRPFLCFVAVVTCRSDRITNDRHGLTFVVLATLHGEPILDSIMETNRLLGQYLTHSFHRTYKLCLIIIKQR